MIQKENEAIKSVKGKIKFTKSITFSSSKLLYQFSNIFTEEQKKFLGAKILRLMPMSLKDIVLERRYKKIMNIKKSSIVIQPGSNEAAVGDQKIL